MTKMTINEKNTREQWQDIPPVVALHRYFIWANKMRTDFDSLLGRNAAKRLTTSHRWGMREIEENLYMSYWYAGLYVVIEGWQALKLRNATINRLLQQQAFVALLKRYRNGVFHFQKTYFDKRFVDVWKQDKSFVGWVRKLNGEFGRFFLEWHAKYQQAKSKEKVK